MPHVLSTIKCSRFILIIFNIIILLFGIALFSLGIFIEVKNDFSAIIIVYNITQAFGGNNMMWTGIILIIIGILIISLAIFGCLACAYKNRFFLNVYACLIILIIIMEFIIVIVILQFRNDIWQSYNSGFENIFQDAYRHKYTEMINMIEQLEQIFECCGVNNSIDYISLSLPIPLSCYPNQNPDYLLFKQGCAIAVNLWIWNISPIIVAVLAMIILLEIFGVVSSLIFAISIHHLVDYEQIN